MSASKVRVTSSEFFQIAMPIEMFDLSEILGAVGMETESRPDRVGARRRRHAYAIDLVVGTHPQRRGSPRQRFENVLVDGAGFSSD